MERKAFAARIWAKLVAFEKAQGLLRPGDRVLAAVSGGPDSVCLAHFLSEMRRRKGFGLGFLYVHHGLRKAADSEAAFVKRLGRALKVPAYVRRVPARAQALKRGRGIEEAARHARYRALAGLARRFGFNKVATGHHLDDQAETVLLHLLRSRRLQALAGIPVRRPLAAGIEVIRPLLRLRRADVLAYLERHRLGFRKDASNRSLKFARNWIRHEILPALERRQPRIREHLARLASDVSARAGGLDDA